MPSDMSFDRTASHALMSLLADGPARTLVERASGQSEQPLYDLQIRSDTKGTGTRATLYYGMTKLIDVCERGGQFSLTAGEKYMALDSFKDAWKSWRPRSSVEQEWPAVEVYLKDVARHVADASALKKEGPVHAAISSGNSDAYRVIQREAGPSFTDTPTREHRHAEWRRPFNEALAARGSGDPWWPRDVNVGSSPDFLAVDIGGRLALIEAKAGSATAGELSKVAVQAGVYARMFADLLEENGQEALDAVARMLGQREALGLSRKGVLHLRERGQVVPVVAIGPDRPPAEFHRRMWEVARAVAGVVGPRVDPLEVWYLDRCGWIEEVERREDVESSPAN